jgi:hypothetical protein
MKSSIVVIVVQKSFFLPQRRKGAEGIISLRLCASAGDHSYHALAEETYLDSYIANTGFLLSQE